MKLPEIPDRGISKRGRAFIKECLAYMRATTPVAGAGISLRELAGGTQINAAAGTSGGDSRIFRVIVGGAARDVEVTKAVLLPEEEDA